MECGTVIYKHFVGLNVMCGIHAGLMISCRSSKILPSRSKGQYYQCLG